MWSRLIVACLLVAVLSCSTTRGVKRGVAVGAGMVAVGVGLLVAANARNGGLGGQSKLEEWGLASGFIGLLVASVSLLQWNRASKREAIARLRDARLGYGSICTAQLDRCDVGLVCRDGRCAMSD